MDTLTKHEDRLIFGGLTLRDIVFYLAIIVSALSFCSNQSIANLCTMVMYGLWAVLAVLLFMTSDMRINYTLLYMLAVYLYAYILIKVLYLSGLYRTNGMGVAGYLLYCVVFYFIGYNLPCNRKKNIVYGMIISYIVAHIIFTLSLYVLLQDTRSETKNMSGQIMGLGILLEILILPRITKNLIIRVLGYIFAVFAIFTLFDLHSRTPFIAIIVVLVFAIFQKKRPFYVYLIFALSVYIVFMFVTTTEKGYELFQEFIIGDHRYTSVEITDADIILSGRPSLYVESIKDFLEHPLIGLGAWAYIDCFPINVLRSGGLLLGVFIIPYAYGKLFSVIFGFKKNTTDIEKDDVRYVLFELAKYLSLFFVVISVMEGYPPLGPGASAFYLWISLGVRDSYIYEKNMNLDRQ